MDFWRAYRVLLRRKWIILMAVFITTGIVSVGLLTYGKKWDGSTWFGPTDQAVRSVVNAGNDNPANQPTLTDDSRMGEAHRISDEAQAADNASRAIYYLANADNVSNELTKVLDGKELDTPGQAPDYDNETGLVATARASMSAGQRQDLERRSGVPQGLWGDFCYLNSKIKYFNISRDFLKSESLADTVTKLLGNIEMTVANSRDIILTVRDEDQRRAEILADALTAAYKDTYDTQNHSAAASNVKFFSQKMVDAHRSFAASLQRYRAWKNAHSDMILPGQIDSIVSTTRTTQNELDQTNTSLRDLDAQIAASQTRLKAVPRMLQHETEAEDPQISNLRDKINALSADLADRQAIYTDKNPEVARLKDRINALKQKLNAVQGHMISSKTVTENPEWVSKDQDIARLVQTRNGLQARIGNLQAVIAKNSSRMRTVPETTTEGDLLSRDYMGAADNMNTVQKKLGQAQEELQQSDAKGALQVRYWAGLPPGTPSHQESPAREGSAKKNAGMIAAAFILSLLLSTGIVLGFDYMDVSVKSYVDVERMLDVPVNGIVPRLEGSARGAIAKITDTLPGSPQAEAYRFLATDLLLSNETQPTKTLMVATAKPGQGGTSTICNLAITLAQAGQTVVLVDADMRRPSLHRVFNLPNEMGLTNVLTNGKIPSDVLQRTEIENLYVMPGGPTAENAWKLLRSAKMRDVIADLQRDFDFVLFDTPSAVVFADAATLATMVDGVLLVVRAHEAPSGSEMQVKNLLNKTSARIVGVVLNDMPVQQVDSARFYNHYYAPGTHPDDVVAGTVAAAGTAGANGAKALPRRNNNHNDDDI